MQDGMIAQSGKYDELVESGLGFNDLVSAHETSMQLVELKPTTSDTTSPRPLRKSLSQNPPSPRPLRKSLSQNPREEDQKALERSKSSFTEGFAEGTSNLIEEEERETGRISLKVYKDYVTEACGWWGVIVVLLFAFLWQGAQMASDYWLAYETADERASSFNPSLFIEVYAAIACLALVLVSGRIIASTILGLRTSQSFFTQILHSILHAPMSFFDTTPSGRILSRVKFLKFLLSH